MNYRRWIAGILALTLVAGIAFAAKKKKKKKEVEEITQTLPLLPDPPSAITTDAANLQFHIAPLSPKGLLSQQVRDGLKALMHDAKGGTIVKIRAFVAGTGDMRRVQTLVSEMFTEKHLTLPALSTIQGGALPGVGVQVSLESIEADRKTVNPHGLAFISGQPGSTVAESVGRIQTAVQSLGIANARVLRTTCFLSSLDNYATLRESVASAFPNAAIAFVQMQRIPVRTAAECEAIAALERPLSKPVEFANPAGLSGTEGYSQVALVGPGKLVITGTQLGFGTQDGDVRLAFERLGKALESNQANFKDVVYARLYPVSYEVVDRLRALRFEFFDKSRPPGSTLLPFESLPSLDASFGVEVIAAPR